MQPWKRRGLERRGKVGFAVVADEVRSLALRASAPYMMLLGDGR
ncbi:MAG TPA: hypothetical protein VJZ49_11720 [Syntrophales bacterium]|nr:hypothetical protein [Syntrophales bacterium]